MDKGWEGPIDFVYHMKGFNEIIALIAGVSKPIIAAVNGAAVGAGFSMVMACDLAIASTNSVFSQIFAKIGLVPDMGSFYFLPRIVGMKKAKELIWKAKMIKAEEALQLGIVNSIVEPDKLEGSVMKLAEEIANGPIVAFKLTKNLLSRSLESNLNDMMQYEAFAQTVCSWTDDHKEGVKAFYEKRKPVYQGK